MPQVDYERAVHPHENVCREHILDLFHAHERCDAFPVCAVEAQKKNGSIDGAYQEKEGPEVAKEILKKVGYNKNIDRICFIIGNHHTPSKIDGLDFQIQWEADLLENLTVMDKEKEQEKIKKCIGENFKTNTGKRIAYNRFILD